MIELSAAATILAIISKELALPLSELAAKLTAKGEVPASREQLKAIVDELNRKHLVVLKDIGEGDELVRVTAEGVVALESKTQANLAKSLAG